MLQELVGLLKELDHLRWHRLEAGDGNSRGLGKMTRYDAAIDSAARILGYAVRVDPEDDELAGSECGIDQRS